MTSLLRLRRRGRTRRAAAATTAGAAFVAAATCLGLLLGLCLRFLLGLGLCLRHGSNGLRFDMCFATRMAPLLRLKCVTAGSAASALLALPGLPPRGPAKASSSGIVRFLLRSLPGSSAKGQFRSRSSEAGRRSGPAEPEAADACFDLTHEA